MTLKNHKLIGVGNVHIPHTWEYANQAAREGASGFTSSDLKKIALQTDDNSLWMLTATTPTWKAICPGGDGHTHSNKAQLDLVTDGDHDARTDNPHSTNLSNLGSGTLAQLNTAITDATLIDTTDSRLSDSRTCDNTFDNAATARTNLGVYSTGEVDAKVVGLYDHKGAYDAGANSPDLDVSPSGVKKGDAYTVSVAGTFFTEAVEVGDVLIADQDDPTLLTHWTRVNKNISFGTTAGTACEGNDSRLSDARTPTAHSASHKHGGSDEVATSTAAANAIPKAGAGGKLAAGWIDDTAHGTRGGGTQHASATTSVAGFMSGADKTKLDGVASGANNYTHPNHTGDVTSVGDGAQTVANNAITNAKLADMAQNLLKGRVSAGSGDPEDLTAAQVRTLLNVADGANNYVLPAASETVVGGAEVASQAETDAGTDDTRMVTPFKLANYSGLGGGSGDLAGVVVGNSASQTLSVGSYGTLNWDTTHYEKDTAVVSHDPVTNNSRLVAQETGAYLVFFALTFDPPTSVAQFDARVIKNGVASALAGSLRMMAEDDEPNDCSNVFLADFTAGDYIEVQGQTSVGVSTIDPSSNFGMLRLRGSKGAQGPAGAGSTVNIEDEGTAVTGTPHSTLNFVGAGVSVANAGGGKATVTIPAATLPYCGEVNGISLATTTSTSHVLATGMSITPPAGTYAVIWAASVGTNSTVDRDAFIRVFSGGTARSSEKRAQRGDSSTDNVIGVTATAKVTVNGSQAIEGRWRVSGSTGEMYGRSLMIVQVAP